MPPAQCVSSDTPPTAMGDKGASPVVCLLGATFATNNMGVNALTVGALKAILHRWPSARVFVLDYDRTSSVYSVDVNGIYRLPTVGIRFSKNLFLSNHVAALLLVALIARALPSERLRQWLYRTNRALGRVAGAEVVVSVAGGDSFSDIYGLINLFYVALPQILCLLMRKRLILFPQTLGPFRSRIAGLVARTIMNRAERVYSRDRLGLASAPQFLFAGKQPAIRFSYDVGLLVDPRPPRDVRIEGLLTPREEPCLVGFNVSGLLTRYGGQFGSRARFPEDYDALIRIIIKVLIENSHAAILLAPHVFGAGPESDSIACERLYSELQTELCGRLGVLKGSYDHHEIKHVIGSCDFFIGSRMHACIAAVSQGVPAVSLAYSSKFIGVMETLDLGGLVADLRTMHADQILRVVRSAFEERSRHRARLREQAPLWREGALNLLSDFQL